MAQRRTLNLSQGQAQELTELRDQTKDEYVRERCAALLKIGQGYAPHWVARQGLLKQRDPDTIYGWIEIYEVEGVAGIQAHQQGGPRRRSV